MGTTTLGVSGTVPLGAGDGLDLRARGVIDLAVTDPILTANGQRARGRLDLDIAVAGTLSAPRASGTIRLTNGDLQDATLGARLRGLTATIQAEGDRLRLVALRGQAGGGTIEASGTLDLAGDMPVALRLRASNARPLTGDLLTVVLDADLALAGPAAGPLLLDGSVRVRRADLRIPEHLPARVATIPVRVAGAPAPPPSRQAMPPIGLGIVVDAPGQIFVRGRGVDAELGGRVSLGGTLSAPQAEGGLSLRRGTYAILGQVIGLSEGRIDFTGAGLADPTLRLVATAQRGEITANAIVSGRVRDPKVTLSSIPERPQDEVLSQLLFNTATARLSPFQVAQLANALASLSGAPSLGADPLQRLRDAVGLDRLTVGTDVAGRPVLEAGRYLADGVYLGTRQGAGGGGTQATIQIDLGRGVKLEATTGTGQTSATGGVDAANASSVGITYQLEY